MSFWKPLFSRFARPAGNRNNNTKLQRHRKAFARARFEALEPRALLTTVTGDFNHDGIADLAIGMPTLTVDGLTNAGEVKILYGTVPSPTAGNPADPGLTGLTALNSQIFTRDTPGLNSSAQAGDKFGSALAVGDFNHDGFMDLAIGASGQSVGGATGAGAVYILFGGKKGLKGTGAQVWTQNTQSINGVAQAGDGFGSALAVGDFNGDHKIDLAIGVPGENVTANNDAGAVNIIFGHVGGLTASSDELIDQSQLNAGTVGVNDAFGSALAAGDFNGDGFADLAVGAPGQTVGGNANAGAVNVIYGSHTGLAAKGNQFWTPGANSLSGTSNANCQFGFALASGDFNDDSRWDLAIGSPGENVGSTNNAGAVHVLLGSSARLTATNNQLWDEGNTLVTGSALTSGDRFGASLAAGSMNGDRLADLAIGAPGETVTSDAGAGSVTVLYAAQASSTQALAGL
ncbi:MAG TPA: FG-GAP repeat protein, partial [Pirellulales bacterium]